MKFKYGERVILDDFSPVTIVGLRHADNWYKVECSTGLSFFVPEYRLRKKETFFKKISLFFKNFCKNK